MADLVPVSGGATPGGAQLLAPLRDPAGGSPMQRLRGFTAQPAVKKVLPWFGGMVGLGALALTWATLAPQPQRVLYSSLSDADRAEVVAALDGASIDYTINNDSGQLTVGEDDLYKARMLVASQGSLAAPETGTQLIDSLPMGASRTLEGDRLRAAQERDLEMTITEIDGIEAVRVHLAQPEKSVFVKDNAPPKASVMVRLAGGRQLSASQVTAIANLVAASVPGLSLDDVRIVDQHGRLLSEGGTDADRLDMQARMEAKLRGQLAQLLTPMLGAANFSSEVQVDLAMDEVTKASESYDKEGAIRRESTSDAQTRDPKGAGGVPGATANTPPPPVNAVPGAPQGNAPAEGEVPPTSNETSASRTYELGREVAVTSTTPGGVRRVTVAVALNQAVMKEAKPADIKKIEDLVSSAVGADNARGDKVTVVVRPFDSQAIDEPAIWETPWFATILRNVVSLLGVLLVLLLGVRPFLKILRPKTEDEAAESEGEEGGEAKPDEGKTADDVVVEMPDSESLSQQVELAQRIVREQPDDALMALRMLLTQEQTRSATEEPAEKAA